MKTIGTVINTIVVVFGMLCGLIAGTFIGYCLSKDDNPRTISDRRYYTNYSKGIYDGHQYRKKWENEENEDI